MLLRHLMTALGLLGASLACTVVIALLVLQVRHERLLGVQTASMAPTFAPDDAVVMRPIKFTDLRLGQVVSYHDPRGPSRLISHRVLSVDTAKQYFGTAGDALGTADQQIPADQLVGRVVAVAPGLGLAMDFLRRPPVLLALVYIPAASLLYSELLRYTAGRHNRHYRHAAGSVD